MTYLQFLGVFLLPPVALVALRLGPRALTGQAGTVLKLAGLALVYTLPWDHWILEQGVWWYPSERVVGLRLGLVPLEEMLFMVLQVALVCGVMALALGYRRGPTRCDRR